MEINTSNSSCVTQSDVPIYQSTMIVFSATNGLSVVVCLFASILVGVLKLYKKPVYRLALYQVLASLTFAIACVVGVIFINYNEAPEVYSRLCVAVGFWYLFTQNLKLYSTLWLTFHLFCFAVFSKNMKKFEPFYVMSSLLISTILSIVPLITDSYGFNGVTCWIREQDENCSSYRRTDIEIIEQYTLWYGPSTTLLVIESVVLLIMVAILVCRFRRRTKHEGTPVREDQNRRAAKQLLPLVAYPMLFCVLIIPPIVFNAYTYTPQPPSPVLIYVSVSSVAAWSLSAGTTLILHVILSAACSRKRRSKPREKINHTTLPRLIENEGTNTVHNDTLDVNSDTHFSMPKDSLSIELSTKVVNA